MTPTTKTAPPAAADSFIPRHIGPTAAATAEMLATVGYDSLDAFIDAVIPPNIRLRKPLAIHGEWSEQEALVSMRRMAGKNRVLRSYIGMGYADTFTPPVIQRNILENPGWYTAYTPYQAEIAQGRLEALLNFQTMVIDLTGLEIANASLLDEGTAAAEAMTMANGIKGADGKHRFFVSDECHPQTIDVVRTRAAVRGIDVVVGDFRTFDIDGSVFGALIQYPTTDGAIHDYRAFCERAHAADALVTVASDLLSLVLLTPPGEWGADIVVGNSQRFGVPMGYGGPHAAFFATRDAFKRQIPGRIIGVSRDADGKPALRMALQTREQHIRREKATSNVCTAQVLLAVMAGMYAVWHGPAGLTNIARRVHRYAVILAAGLERLGYRVGHAEFFDTIRVEIQPQSTQTTQKLLDAAVQAGYNLRPLGDSAIGIALDETTTEQDLADAARRVRPGQARAGGRRAGGQGGRPVRRTVRAHERLPHAPGVPLASQRDRDAALHAQAGIARPVAHALDDSARLLHDEAERDRRDDADHLARVREAASVRAAGSGGRLYRTVRAARTPRCARSPGSRAMSLQPNAGSQGEYTGLLVIRRYHAARGEGHRTRVPDPAVRPRHQPGERRHGRHAGGGGEDGRPRQHRRRRSRGEGQGARAEPGRAHGDLSVHARRVRRRRSPTSAGMVHEHGGQVYMDGANMNAMVGLARPGDIGADVCHLNLHKTFCIPHGGGGPGMGPIGVAKHLRRSCPATSSWTAATQRRRGLVGALGQREHPSDLDDVHRHDGRRGTHRGHEDRDPERELHGQAARAALSGAVQGRQRVHCARVHRRSARTQDARPASRRRTSPSG